MKVGIEEVECGKTINVLSLPKYVQYHQTKQVATGGKENMQATSNQVPQFVSHIQHAIISTIYIPRPSLKT